MAPSLVAGYRVGVVPERFAAGIDPDEDQITCLRFVGPGVAGDQDPAGAAVNPESVLISQISSPPAP